MQQWIKNSLQTSIVVTIATLGVQVNGSLFVANVAQMSQCHFATTDRIRCKLEIGA